MIHKDTVEQSRANLLKTVRTAIRLKYSLLADDEINEVLPLVEAKFNASVLRGVLPNPVDIKKAIGVG